MPAQHPPGDANQTRVPLPLRHGYITLLAARAMDDLCHAGYSCRWSHGPDRRGRNTFCEFVEEHMNNQVIAVCFAAAALVVLVFYLSRRRKRVVFK